MQHGAGRRGVASVTRPKAVAETLKRPVELERHFQTPGSDTELRRQLAQIVETAATRKVGARVGLAVAMARILVQHWAGRQGITGVIRAKTATAALKQRAVHMRRVQPL